MALYKAKSNKLCIREEPLNSIKQQIKYCQGHRICTMAMNKQGTKKKQTNKKTNRQKNKKITNKKKTTTKKQTNKNVSVALHVCFESILLLI